MKRRNQTEGTRMMVRRTIASFLQLQKEVKSKPYDWLVSTEILHKTSTEPNGSKSHVAQEHSDLKPVRFSLSLFCCLNVHLRHRTVLCCVFIHSLRAFVVSHIIHLFLCFQISKYGRLQYLQGLQRIFFFLR